MPRYFCLNSIDPEGLAHFTAQYKAADSLDNAQAILVRSADMHGLALPDAVLAVARAGAGVNNIPLTEYAAKGIVVFNTPGANANGVKELTLAGLFLASRDIVGGINWVHANKDAPDLKKMAESQKKQFAGCEISGKSLGVIGLGAIGVQVANTACRLGMEVFGCDPYISVDAAWNLSRSVRHVTDVNEIFRTCDYITIHVPLNDGTRKMIDRDAIAQMKPGAVLLNFARDPLVDEDALIEALNEGRIARYVTDFPTVKIANTKNAIVLPHLGASTHESEVNCACMAAAQLMDYLENGNIRHSVNFPDCDMGALASPVRIAIAHKNIKNMIGSFTAALSEEGHNIENMINRSRGEYAYSMFDLESAVSEEIIQKLRSIDGVLKVRVMTL